MGAPSAASPGKPRPHIASLDALRAGAILWVVLYHLGGAGLLPDSAGRAAAMFVASGDAGVDLFFVLSGYLISSIALAELAATGRLSARRFWYRRWMRTLPAYYATLVAVALGDLFYSAAGTWRPAWSYAAFLQTFTVGFDRMRFGWSWSLCVEEQFYLALPLLVALACGAGRLRPVVAFRLIAALALATSIAGRAWLDASGGPTGGHTPGYGVTYCRLDGIAAGVTVATLPPVRSRAWSAGLGLGAACLLGVYVWSDRPHWLDVQRFAPVSLMFGGLVYASVSNSRWRDAAVPGAAGVAAISYSLYLTHPIVVILAGRLAAPWPVKLVAFTAASLAAACLLRYAVERPLLRLRDARRVAG